MKKCPSCKRELNTTEFYKSKREKDGFNYYCKVCQSKMRKEYYINNKVKELKQHQKYNKLHIKEIKARYQNSKEHNRKYQNFKYKTDLNHRIAKCMRARLAKALKRNTKSGNAIKLLDCSIEFLKYYLEKQFSKGMSWSNYGKWHIDHIRPCNSYDLSKPGEQALCFHYTNLQPLWALDNMKKHDKIIKGD